LKEEKMNCADILKSLAEIEMVILESYNADTPVQVSDAARAIEAIRRIEKEVGTSEKP
jgi:hypothetical protein